MEVEQVDPIAALVLEQSLGDSDNSVVAEGIKLGFDLRKLKGKVDASATDVDLLSPAGSDAVIRFNGTIQVSDKVKLNAFFLTKPSEIGREYHLTIDGAVSLDGAKWLKEYNGQITAALKEAKLDGALLGKITFDWWPGEWKITVMLRAKNVQIRPKIALPDAQITLVVVSGNLVEIKANGTVKIGGKEKRNEEEQPAQEPPAPPAAAPRNEVELSAEFWYRSSAPADASSESVLEGSKKDDDDSLSLLSVVQKKIDAFKKDVNALYPLDAEPSKEEDKKKMEGEMVTEKNVITVTLKGRANLVKKGLASLKEVLPEIMEESPQNGDEPHPSLHHYFKADLHLYDAHIKIVDGSVRVARIDIAANNFDLGVVKESLKGKKMSGRIVAGIFRQQSSDSFQFCLLGLCGADLKGEKTRNAFDITLWLEGRLLKFFHGQFEIHGVKMLQ